MDGSFFQGSLFVITVTHKQNVEFPTFNPLKPSIFYAFI